METHGTTKKNLLFVFADQWRRAAMGFANEDAVITPNMDAFASQSVYCDGAISTFPLCSPHRACLLSGRWPQSTGVFTNCKPGLDVRLGDDEVCIGQALHESGYQTGYIGKWHLDEPELNHSEQPASGARAWDAFTPPGVRRHGFDFWYSYGAWDAHLAPHYWRDTPDMIQVQDWSPRHETQVAIDYIKSRDQSKPFSLFVSWNPPHSPYDQVPPEYLALYEGKDLKLRPNVELEHLHHHTSETVGYNEEQMLETTRQYFAAISGLDDQFGRLLATLREEGIADDTIVVLTADHGDMMGSHGLMAKHVWYEESVGIPFVVGGAGLPAGRCGTVFGSADVAPTLLGLLDVDVPPQMQGVDLSASLAQCETVQDSLTYLYATPGGPNLVGPLRAAGIDPRNVGWRGVRNIRYSYVTDVGYTPTPCLRRLLYDLQTDPYQQAPLVLEHAGQHPEAEKLEAQLLEWLHAQNDAFARHLEA